MFQHVQLSSGISLRSAAQSHLACRHVQQRLLVARANQSPPPPSPAATPTLAAPAKQHPWLIVGIGNPGQKYEKTRHNVGFEMIDAIAEAEGIKLNTIQHKALTGKGEIGSAQVLLAKPQTFVNLSGGSVGPLAAYYRIPVQQILVVFDDMDLNFGVMRLLPKGGHGGHNGMRSVIDSLKGCREFPRLKIAWMLYKDRLPHPFLRDNYKFSKDSKVFSISPHEDFLKAGGIPQITTRMQGIGRPPGTMDPAAYVLQKFDKSEREEMDIQIARGVDAIRQATKEGILKAASTWNQVRKSRMRLTEKEMEILKQI